MKMNILIGVILLGSVGLIAEGIEENMSYKLGSSTYFDYTIKGNGEECEVTYRENKELTDTTCLSSINSKGLTIYCTKTKKICKTKNEIDDFVNPSSQDDVSSKISAILADWVKAHNDNDMKLLSKLYSTELTYYGKKSTRKKCIKDKKRALKKYPNFYQSLEEVDYSEVTPNMYKVTFNKLVRLQNNGKLNVYPSYLLIDISTSSILVEGDEITDNNKKDNKTKPLVLKEKKIVNQTSNYDCTETITPREFNNLNPYKAKGKCINAEYQIVNVLSETEAFAYDIKYKISPYNLSVTGTSLGDKAVLIEAKGSLSDNFTKGAKIKGLFKIVGTDKATLVSGEEVTVNLLTYLEKK